MSDFPPCTDAGFPSRSARTALIIVIVLTDWLRQFPQARPWHAELDTVIHASMMTLTMSLIIEAVRAGNRVFQRVCRTIAESLSAFLTWTSQHVRFKFGMTFQLGNTVTEGNSGRTTG